MATPTGPIRAARTGTCTTTPEAGRLFLQQILSPAFPVGGFAWSQGLEWAMDQGLASRSSIGTWLADWLDHGSGRTDALLVALSLRPNADHAELDDLARAACLTSQRLTETTEQGAALIAALQALDSVPLPVISPPVGAAPARVALPVAFGRACMSLPLPASEILSAWLMAQTASLVSAAVRFMPLGPQEGQRLLAGLVPAILARAEWASTAPPEALAGATWGAEIAAMRHETMTTRIFRS